METVAGQSTRVSKGPRGIEQRKIVHRLGGTSAGADDICVGRMVGIDAGIH